MFLQPQILQPLKYNLLFFTERRSAFYRREEYFLKLQFKKSLHYNLLLFTEGRSAFYNYRSYSSLKYNHLYFTAKEECFLQATVPTAPIIITFYFHKKGRSTFYSYSFYSSLKYNLPFFHRRGADQYSG